MRTSSLWRASIVLQMKYQYMMEIVANILESI